MTILNIFNLKIYIFVTLLLICIASNTVIKAANDKGSKEEEDQVRDQVILNDGVTMYLGKDVTATINADFKVYDNSSNPNKEDGASDAKIHMADTSLLNVTGNLLIDVKNAGGVNHVFNMGKDTYLNLYSNEEPQYIESLSNIGDEIIAIPNLAFDGSSPKALKTKVNVQHLNINNSKLDLMSSDLIIQPSQDDQNNPIIGDRGFILSSHSTDTGFVDEENKGKVVIHMASNRPYKMPLGVNEPELDAAPRIMNIVTNKDAVLGFQLLAVTPNTISNPEIENTINQHYYYKLYDMSGTNTDIAVDMDVSYDRSIEGDFGNLAYYDENDTWHELNSKFEYNNIQVVPSSGSLLTSTSLVSQFRAVRVSGLNLNSNLNDNSLFYLPSAKQNKPVLTFTLLKNHESDFYIPNIFTPNNDGINDTFEITGLSDISSTGTVKLEIYQNVRGTPVLVYKKDKYSGGWDGNNLADGVYFYNITFTDKEGNLKSYKGDVTIKR